MTLLQCAKAYNLPEHRTAKSGDARPVCIAGNEPFAQGSAVCRDNYLIFREYYRNFWEYYLNFREYYRSFREDYISFR
jgi:hypothetical protein